MSGDKALFLDELSESKLERAPGENIPLPLAILASTCKLILRFSSLESLVAKSSPSGELALSLIGALIDGVVSLPEKLLKLLRVAVFAGWYEPRMPRAKLSRDCDAPRYKLDNERFSLCKSAF